MLKIRLECKGITSYKIGSCLDKFGKKFPFKYKIEVEGTKIISEFQVISMSSLNELTRRLKHIKNADFEYIQIEKVLEHE